MFEAPALRKAKSSVDKALNFKRRERMFISRLLVWQTSPNIIAYVGVLVRQKVEEMLEWSSLHPELRLHALLFLFSYTFLLRVPSEALPTVVGFEGFPTKSNSMIHKGANESLVLVLRKRKNKPEGSRLIRKCSCVKSPASCAYHLIGQLIDEVPIGSPLFGSISPSGTVVFAQVQLGCPLYFLFGAQKASRLCVGYSVRWEPNGRSSTDRMTCAGVMLRICVCLVCILLSHAAGALAQSSSLCGVAAACRCTTLEDTGGWGVALSRIHAVP